MSRRRNNKIKRVSKIQNVLTAKDQVVKNDNGNLTHNTEYFRGEKREYFIEYYKEGLPNHFISNYGYEWWCQYNSLGNIYRFWDNTGYEEEYKYCKGGIVICKSTEGIIKKRIDRKSFPVITRYIFNIANMNSIV